MQKTLQGGLHNKQALSTREVLLKNAGHVFQLRNFILPEVEHGEVALELLTSMLRVQLSQLCEHCSPGLDFFSSVLYSVNRLPSAVHTLQCLSFETPRCISYNC